MITHTNSAAYTNVSPPRDSEVLQLVSTSSEEVGRRGAPGKAPYAPKSRFGRGPEKQWIFD